MPSGRSFALRTASVVLVTVMVALAGCSLLGGAPTGTSTGAGAPPTGGASGTANAASSPTPSPYPPGYDASGVTDAEAAVETHVGALFEAGSFVVEYNGTVLSDGNGDTARIDALQAVDVSTRRAYVVTSASGRGTTTQYFANDTVYVRRDPPGENDTEYRSRSYRFEPRRFAGRGLVSPLLRHVEYGNATALQRNGETVFRYRATDVSRLQPILGRTVDPRNVTAFDAGIVVDRDGIVRRAAYEARIDRGNETLSLEVRIDYLGYGSTTVEPPTWLEKAEEAEDNRN